MDLLQWKVVRLIPEAKDTISYVLEEISGQGSSSPSSSITMARK